MKTQTFVLSLLTAGIVAVPTFAAQAQGCCSGMSSMSSCSGMSGMDMSGQPSQAAQPATVANKLPQPVAAVFDNYLHIQTALASDSLEGVAQNAQTISKSIKDDSMTTFSETVPQKADAVAKAADLQAARKEFKTLSQSLIEYLSKYPALAGSFRQVHCSMADADWLQTDSVVNNPYMGKAMAHCGQFVKTSSSASSGQQDSSMPGMKM